MKVQNTTGSDLILPGGKLVPANGAAEVKDWDKCLKSPIVKIWVEAGHLEPEAKAPKKAKAPTERDKLKAEAEELGLEYPGNIKTEALAELIKAEKAKTSEGTGEGNDN